MRERVYIETRGGGSDRTVGHFPGPSHRAAISNSLQVWIPANLTSGSRRRRGAAHSR